MVIDKTTGRGCAWGMVSKTVCRDLIADGIIDKPICRKARKNGYDLMRVVRWRKDIYVKPRKDDGAPREPLWAPSFIHEEGWTRAAGKFRPHGLLDANVERYLLPEMEEYLQNIPDTDLVLLVRDFLLEKGVINTPVRQHAGKTYYFDQKEVYTLDTMSPLFLYDERQSLDTFQIKLKTRVNLAVWRKAVSRFEAGMTLNQCIEAFLHTTLDHSALR